MNRESLKRTAIIFSIVLVILTGYILVNGFYASKDVAVEPTPTPTIAPTPTATPKPTENLEKKWDESVQSGGQWVVYTSRNIYALLFNTDGTAEKAACSPAKSSRISESSTNDELFEFAMNSGTSRAGKYTITNNKIKLTLDSGGTYNYTYDSKTNTIKASDGTVYNFLDQQ